MAEGQNIEGGQQSGMLGAWRRRFADFLRTGPSQPGERRGPAPAAPLKRTETPTPLQDIRDKRI